MEREEFSGYRPNRSVLKTAAKALLVAYIGGAIFSFADGKDASNDEKPHHVSSAMQEPPHIERAAKLQPDPSMENGSDITKLVEGFVLGTMVVGGVALIRSGLNRQKLPDVSGLRGTHDAIGYDDYTRGWFIKITEPYVDELKYTEEYVLGDF